MFKIAWRIAGFSCGNRGFGMSGIPEIGNAAPINTPCAIGAMRSFVVDRPLPSLSHPAMAYCQEGEWTTWRAYKTTYVAFLP